MAPSRSSSVSSDQQATVLSSSELAMTRLYPPKSYTNFRDLNRAIAITKEKLRTQGVTQYLCFKHVSAQNFESIDERRSQLCTAISKPSLSKYPHLNMRSIGEEVILQCRNMGIGRSELLALQATRYVGPTASQKEADASWKNPTLRPRHSDWPSLVIEAGVSESMPRLKQDAAWWISNSAGQVQIVLLIKVTKTSKEVLIEKYIPKQAVFPNTRARAGLPPVYVPELVSTTTVNQGSNPPTVGGDQLILEFQSVIGRAPIPPERDIQYTAAILLDATRYVFEN